MQGKMTGFGGVGGVKIPPQWKVIVINFERNNASVSLPPSAPKIEMAVTGA
ncbi:hypothetical protein [Coxiella burnetii]|uniref:hypothetical protein n=1 Tax=Coxiella burnetii TaxID=777 RepID=UPI001EDF0521|nr:hypothetical protein [Coxiella burnetii]UYK68992.1 hypothetical protein OHM78_06115 [Coxiella burnetii]